MEIQEGNKLIAEFMGCYGAEHWAGGEAVYRYGFKNTHITDRWHLSGFAERTPYHSSWDWLMPVVEKIEKVLKDETLFTESLDANLSILNSNHASIFSPIEIVWEYVIQFIQWYNTRNE